MSESQFDKNLRMLQDAVRRQDPISPEEAEALHRAREELLAEDQSVDAPDQQVASSFARRTICTMLGTLSPPPIRRHFATWARDKCPPAPR